MPQVTLSRALVEFAGFVRAHHGLPPTTREFAEVMGLASNNGGAYWLTALLTERYISHAVPTRRGRGGPDYYLTPHGEEAADRLLVEAAS